MKKSTSGFTIVELLIVIVVIAVLAAISIVAYGNIQKKAQVSATESSMRSITSRLDVYKAAEEVFPTSLTDCAGSGAMTLCMDESGHEISYSRVSIATGYRTILEESYDLSLLADDYFIYQGYGERTGSREFMQYVDLAPFIDRYGLREYQLSFEIKSADTSQRSTSSVYFQNGSGARYSCPCSGVPVTEEFTRHTIRFTPVLTTPGIAEAWLAFYGIYDSGNILTVRNVEFRPV